MNQTLTFLRSLFITVTLALLWGLVILISPLSAHASLSPKTSSLLVETINKAGVSVVFNDSEVCQLPVLGVYQPGEDRIVICQQRAEQLDGVEHQWTRRDSVVLRHESTHLLQDCLSGQRGDYHLTPMTQTPADLMEYILGKLSPDDIKNINEIYREAGADDLTIWLELEAFATQDTVSDDAMSQRMQQVCNIK